MSLINDAIKRANERKPGAPASGGTHIHLEPVAAKSAPRWPIIVMPLLLATMISLGVMFILKGWDSQTSTTTSPVPVSARENGTPPILPSNAGVAPPAEGASIRASLPAETSPAHEPAQEWVAASEPAAPAAPPEPVVPTFPDLKLKGIYYRPSNPSAVINNKALFIGERISQARVISITEDSVTVKWQEETRVLTMQ